jgi:hypothetical protein
MHVVNKGMVLQGDQLSDEELENTTVEIATARTLAATSPHNMVLHGNVISLTIVCIALIVGFIMIA